MCLYGDARELDNTPKAIKQIKAFEKFSKKTLFILEDCHNDPNFWKVEELLKQLDTKRENTALLLTTRHTGSEDSLLGTFGKIFVLRPEKLRKNIVKNRIEQLRRKSEYVGSPFFPKKNEDMENQIDQLLTALPNKNLKVLDLHLRAWDPLSKYLAEVDEETVLDYFLKHMDPPIYSNESKDCLLPLCAIDQYEIAVHMNFLDSDALWRLRGRGLVRCNDASGLCMFHDSSEAIWYLKAAAKAHYLQVEDRPANVKEYVKYHILKYAASSPNPLYLLRGLRDYNESGLSQEVIQNLGFQDNILRVSKEPDFRADVPNLFYELRMLGRIDICSSLFQSFTDSDLDDIGKIGVDTLGRYLHEFHKWGWVGKDSAKRLMYQQSVQPEILAKKFMTGMKLCQYNIADLVKLVYNLNWLGNKSYKLCEFIELLDRPTIKSKFPTTNLKIYADLLALVKYSKCGINYVVELTPPSEMTRSRVRDGTGRNLRDMMDALLMPDRTQLWRTLTDADLQEIVSRSTIHQLHTLLVDGLKSKDNKYKQLGREIAYGLVKLDLSAPIKQSNLHDLSMFTHAVLMLKPNLDRELLERVLPDLKGVIDRENKNRIFDKLSLMLRDFREQGDLDLSSVPLAADEFLQELIQLNLLPYIQTSAVGLSHMMYWAIMTNKELSRKLFLDVDDQIWKDKILEVSEGEAFYIMWNIWKVEPSRVCSFVDEESEISDKIARTPHGRGLLMLCGVVFEDNTIILPQLTNNLAEPWDPTKLTLTLKVLCQHSLHEVAIQFRESVDMEKLSDAIQNAVILEDVKKLFIKITGEFKTFTDPGC